MPFYQTHNLLRDHVIGAIFGKYLNKKENSISVYI